MAGPDTVVESVPPPDRGLDGIFSAQDLEIVQLEGMNKTLIYPGGHMNYTLVGTGRPLILLHGFGESGTIWQHQVEGLAEVCRVIVPDLPGSGSSPMPEQGSPDTLEFYADLLAALLDKEELAACTLIGHSMGGYIALAFAEKYPERLEAFGLFHSTALADSEQRRELRQKGIRFMQEYGPAAFLKEVIPGLYAESFRSASPQMIQAHLAESTQWATAEALTAYYRAMMSRPDRTHVLADFKGPILFILGALDKTVVLEETIPQTKLAKHSFVQVMEAAAHMGMREDPRSTSLALIDFILARKRP